MDMDVFWDVALCSLVAIYRRFIPLKHRPSSTRVQGTTSQKTAIFIHFTQVQIICQYLRILVVVLGGLVIIVLAIGPKVSGFKAGRGRWIFKDDKNPYHDFLRRESKNVGPIS
jgi:hypothetical protein